MKVDLHVSFLNLANGKALTDEQGAELTLKNVLVGALMMMTEDDKNVSGKEKFIRYQLAEKISQGNGSVDLSVSEVAKCLDLVGKNYWPAVVGPVYAALDPEKT